MWRELTGCGYWHGEIWNVRKNGEVFAELLARHPEVRPADLELEILETSALQDVVHVAQLIETCRQMGVRFALDDFGTGYASLTCLRRLRVAQIKIDQSFVRDMLDDPDDKAILDGIIRLAGAFRCAVIAEGVETIAHCTLLLQMGCELAQGFGIARPMPAGRSARLGRQLAARCRLARGVASRAPGAIMAGNEVA